MRAEAAIRAQTKSERLTLKQKREAARAARRDQRIAAREAKAKSQSESRAKTVAERAAKDAFARELRKTSPVQLMRATEKAFIDAQWEKFKSAERQAA